jgi:hypothetical protein
MELSSPSRSGHRRTIHAGVRDAEFSDLSFAMLGLSVCPDRTARRRRTLTDCEGKALVNRPAGEKPPGDTVCPPQGFKHLEGQAFSLSRPLLQPARACAPEVCELRSDPRLGPGFWLLGDSLSTDRLKIRGNHD